MSIKEPWILAGGEAWEMHLGRLEKARAKAPSAALDEAIRRAATMVDICLLRDPADLDIAHDLLREMKQAEGPSMVTRMDPSLPLPPARRRKG